MSVSIVVADDHPLLRRGLRSLLESESGFTVVGEACEGRETIRLVERLRPHVLILDVMMPGLNGPTGIRVLHECSADTRIVVLSPQHAVPVVADALNCG